jgi:hypothetical protein
MLPTTNADPGRDLRAARERLGITRAQLAGLAVVPDDVVNPGEGWAVADRAVVASRVVVLQPVWQGLATGV